MIVDTSALVAILKGESDVEVYIDALDRSSSTRITAPNYLECKIVMSLVPDPVLHRSLDQLLMEAEIQVTEFTEKLAVIAHRAYLDFGKGTGHPAQLNYGDCMSYALAAQSNEPLLWKGDDFTHTGIRSALTELS